MIEVLSIATPDYSKQWSFCIRSHQEYCRRHGLVYHLYDGLNQPLHPKWFKLQRTLEALLTSEAVMLIDADAQFAPNSPSFAPLLTDHPEADIFFCNGVSGRLNSGVMIFRGGLGSVAAEFLEYTLERRLLPVQSDNFVTEEGENGHLIEAIQSENFKQRSVVIPSVWNCTVPEGFSDAYIWHFTDRMRNALDRGQLPIRRPMASYKRIYRKFLKRIKVE